MSKKQARLSEDKFVIRLPDGMRERIAIEAHHNARSMNSEIVYRLETTLELEAALERALKIIDQLLAASSPMSSLEPEYETVSRADHEREATGASLCINVAGGIAHELLHR